MKHETYRGLIASDWNQCLAPCGPFDVISYSYPQLASDISALFKRYTGNEITLGAAVEKIVSFLPAPLSMEQMDVYLDSSFEIYPGVAELMDWCLNNGILFMINTTGPVGYFQRVFAKKLLPRIPVLAANPIIRYPDSACDPLVYELKETWEKAEYTARVMQTNRISTKKTVVIGDSGGDGPHFAWAENHSIYKIGSMTKQSLLNFCRKNKITINMHIGPTYPQGEKRDVSQEMKTDFAALRSILENICC